MSLNLSQIIFEVAELGVRSIRIDSDAKRFVNRAQKKICERRNWSFMRDLINRTIIAQEFSVNMPSDFKELCEERSPVTFNQPTNGAPLPCYITSRARLDRLNFWSYWPFASTYIGFYTIQYVFMEQRRDPPGDNTNDGPWTLNISRWYPNSTDITYNISCYRYVPDLVLGTDHNPLTDHGDLGDALINLTKALCYFSEDPTDPRGQAAMAIYENAYRSAAYTDARQKVGGQSVHF